MATIFRKKRLRYLHNGKRITATEARQLQAEGQHVECRIEYGKTWRIRYRLPDGRVREVSGYTDKAATKALATNLERNAAREAAGLVNPADRHLLEAVDKHLDDYIADLAAKGRCAAHVTGTRNRILALLHATRITRLVELEPAKVQAFLNSLKDAGRNIDTRNHYLVSIKSFARWLWRTGRLASNPLAGLSSQNADTDRRRLRRALTADELSRVVAAAEKSTKVYRGLSGPDRAALYVLAAGSGLRAGELANLTYDHLVLDAVPPVVCVDAAYSKNRRQDVIPLPAQVADYLRRWLASKGRIQDTRALLWPGKWRPWAAYVLQKDLVAAGIPRRDASGRGVDFHSLRSTYATLLARQGCNLQTAQALMRHADPKLTARTYTKLGITDLGMVVSDLVVLDQPTASAEGATGVVGPPKGPPLPVSSLRQCAQLCAIRRTPAEC